VAGLGIRRLAGGLFAGATILVLVPSMVSANPIPVDQADTRILFGPGSIFMLLSLNFIVNLFLFSVAFLVLASIWGKNVGNLPPDRDRFLLMLLVGVAGITFFGALIDIGLLYNWSGPYAFLQYDLAWWMMAALLVLASVYLVGHYLMRIRRRVSLLIGSFMAAVNLGYWYSLVGSTADPALVPLLLLFVLPFVLFLVRRWHRKVFQTGGPASTGPAPGPASGPAPRPEEPALALTGEAVEGSTADPASTVDDIEKVIDGLDG
jgi:hypothetical protein